MGDPLRETRDALERAQTAVKKVRARLDDASDAERTAEALRDERARLEARAGQLSRELPELREMTEASRLTALEAKRVAAEASKSSLAASARLLGTVAAAGGGLALGVTFGHGLWENIAWPWLPWVFGLPAGAMLVRELFELGQKLGLPYRDE
ncbi:MAG: hypothetical protein QM723_26205 [Myxococcaceae bacterium]